MQRTAELDRSFMTQVKQQLLKEATDLERELAETQETPMFGSSEDDAVQTVEVTLEHQSLRAKLMHLLTGVRRALHLIDAGEYGLCSNCKEPIERARLEAMPTATLCVSCQAKHRR